MEGPRKIGICKIPPYGLKFDEYRPDKHGRLVDTYATASYDGKSGGCARCGGAGCAHDELLGKFLSEEEWAILPEKVLITAPHYSGLIDKRAIWHRKGTP